MSTIRGVTKPERIRHTLEWASFLVPQACGQESDGASFCRTDDPEAMCDGKLGGSSMNDLAASIRTIPDYPKPGILFRDITTLLGDARAFRRAVDELVQPWAGTKIDKVAGIEARGFILGGAVAHQLSAGFVPVRKKGKLPHTTVSIAYSLEYGLDEMEMHEDAVKPGERVILVDDLIATGGTADGAVQAAAQARRRDRRRLFRHRPAGSRRGEETRGAGRAVRSLVAFEGH